MKWPRPSRREVSAIIKEIYDQGRNDNRFVKILLTKYNKLFNEYKNEIKK